MPELRPLLDQLVTLDLTEIALVLVSFQVQRRMVFARPGEAAVPLQETASTPVPAGAP